MTFLMQKQKILLFKQTKSVQAIITITPTKHGVMQKAMTYASTVQSLALVEQQKQSWIM